MTKSAPHVYRRRVQYHETDAMGVVHHSNYIKFFEEGRVSWIRDRGIVGLHKPEGNLTFAVVNLDCQFLKTARFDDPIEVWVQGHVDGVKMRFRYAVWNDRSQVWCATGHTDLVPLNEDLKVTRLPAALRDAFGKEQWGHAWPPPHH